MTRRPARRLVVRGVVAAAAITLGLNVVGVLRYPGGPLREPSADALLWLDIRPANQGSNLVGDVSGSWHAIDVPLQFGILSLSNPSGFTATIESVTPVDPTQGLIVDAVYVLKPDGSHREIAAWGTPGVYPPAETLASDFTTLPAIVVPTGDSHEHDPAVILYVRSPVAGPIGWSALAVDYRIGPFTFRTIQHDALAGCLGPLAAGSQCGDGAADPEGEEGEGGGAGETP
jgi:hypothetical protein